MRHLIVILPAFILSVFPMKGQDSLRRIKLKLSSAELRIMPATNDYYCSYTEIKRFSKGSMLARETAGYSEGSKDYYEFEDIIDGDANLNFSIKNTERKFLNRVQPRFGVYYSKRVFISNSMGFFSASRVDTLYFTDPKISPLYIDSVSYGILNLKYRTSQVLIEIGANIDIIRLRYFKFYGGAVYGQGISYKNEFIAEKFESSQVDVYPGQVYPQRTIHKDYTITENGKSCLVSKVILAVGMQHRFVNRRNFAPGFFLELRPGVEYYKPQGEKTFRKSILSFAGGVRFSFEKHK